jgi:putative FmdB family regulatory protein
MPTYEYACPKCGIVEVFQSIKEDALKKCPQCKKQKVTRIVSKGGGVIFKGSGFWETDYNRSADYGKKSKEESGSAPATPDTKSKTQAQPKKADPPASTPTKPDAGGPKK